MDSVERHRNGMFDGVVLGFCDDGQVRHEFFDSVIGTYLYDHSQQGVLLDAGGGYCGVISGPRVAETRSQIVDQFLTNHSFVDERGLRAQWLWMVDSDMCWDADAFYRLLASADPIDRPIVGGLCFAGGRTGTPFPTIYRLHRENPEAHFEIEPVHEYPKGAMVKVGATGAAFMVIHRSVFVQMSQPWPKGFGTKPDGTPNPYPWFSEGGTDAKGNPYGEDTAFCIKAAACGIPTYVNTDVRIGHVKSHVIDERYYEQRRDSLPVH